VPAKVLGGVQGEIGFRPDDRYDVTDRVIGFDDNRELPNITRGLVKARLLGRASARHSR